jgi:hypothetical protein
MSRPSLRKTSSLLLALCLTAGCDSPTEVCTLIGCLSGLTVQLNSLPVGSFTVEVLPEVALENPPIYRVECPGVSEPCSSAIRFPDLFPARVRVRVTTSLGTITHPATNVSYNTTYPNGRQCSPACRRGTITANIPE